MNKAASLFRVIVFRSGGIGDILITLPLLDELTRIYQEVYLCVPSKYHFLIKEISGSINLFNLDEGEDKLLEFGFDSDLISFWDDPTWTKKWEKIGVKKIISFNPRPTSGPHFAKSMIERLGQPIERFELDRNWLSKAPTYLPTELGKKLWIHPGSGSIQKNLPIERICQWIDHWLMKDSKNQVQLSFGEADLILRDQFLSHYSLRKRRVNLETFEALETFFSKLSKHTGPFIGNDSGPSHMAAMLGIKTPVYFKITNPVVWAPLGASVTLYEDEESVPNSIL